jgi:Glycosyltransferases involved in cell wall biogenesis
MKKLSIVVCTYFNERSLPLLYTRLKEVERALHEKNISMELVFVDDGSLDHSFNELLKIKRLRPTDTRVIKLTRNFGAVRAAKIGCQHVSGDCFMILAADLQDPPEIIVNMAAEWLSGSKFVICVRQDREDPWLAQQFGKLFYMLLRLIVDKSYPKQGFDMALMDKALLPYLLNSGKNVFTPVYMYRLGFTPTTLRYKREKRLHGKSRWTFQKKLTAFLDVFLGFSIFPIRFISYIGIFVSCMSIAYGLVIFTNVLFGKATIPGFASIMTFTSFLLGMIIVMLGIIGEYLWRTFEEVSPRPEAVIEEIY